MDPQQMGIDLPAGNSIARIRFQPEDDQGRPTEIDGAVIATVLTGDAETVVGGVKGLFVDIKLPSIEGSMATVEVDADPNLEAGKQEETITTIITLRRLGRPVGQAVTLGGKPENVSFPAIDDFGVFTVPTAASRRGNPAAKYPATTAERRAQRRGR